MRKYKGIISAAVIIAIITAACVGFAATAETAPDNTRELSGAGSYISSEEVVYALLGGDGAAKNVWVVGTLDVNQAGNITVFGDFTELKNLTSTGEITNNGSSVTMNTQGVNSNRFYWQGTLAENELPWNIDISYKLDGRAISAEYLAGKDGEFDMIIKTSRNENVDEVFYENYMLQVTVTLDADRFQHPETNGATVANSGGSKTFAFTVMPGTDGLLELNAFAFDFELQSITFAAVPYTMDIELGDLSSYTGDLTQLSDAISELNKGVQELNDGAKTLSDGAAKLTNGSSEFKSGLEQISAGSAQLKDGSGAIVNALGGLEDSDLSSLAKLPESLRQISSGLSEISSTLSELSGGYSKALDALSSAIDEIPEPDISEADINSLLSANPNSKALKSLVANYQAAQTVKATYASVSEAFDGVKAALPALSRSVSQTNLSVTIMAQQIEAGLGGDMSGLGDMASQYMQFHNGLVAYVDGVVELSKGYAELHNGIKGLSDGTSQFSDGVSELANGVSQLDAETSKLPDEIDNMADELISDFTGGDFELVSFLSPQNESVELVQFVFRTDSIKLPEPPAEAAPVAEKATVWSRLLDLFR